MGGKFDITAAFQAAVRDVSDSDTSRDQIEYIDIALLREDPGNFYSLDGIDELAANIQLCGLQQPIRVRAGEDGSYTIVSGHRRRAALSLLAREEPDKWSSVPCIMERDQASPELRELRLILANASTRVLSPAEVAKQAAKVEELLVQLKEQGYQFPGPDAEPGGGGLSGVRLQAGPAQGHPGAPDPQLAGQVRGRAAGRGPGLPAGPPERGAAGVGGGYVYRWIPRQV